MTSRWSAGFAAIVEHTDDLTFVGDAADGLEAVELARDCDRTCC